LVKWEDGTWQLFIGSEGFDIQTIKNKQDYLYVQHPNGLYQNEGAAPTRFIVKPPVAVVQKERKIMLVTPDQNPEQLNEALQKVWMNYY